MEHRHAAILLLTALLLPCAAVAASGGPGPGGYSWLDQDEPGVAYGFDPINDGVNLTNLEGQDDAFEWGVPIGFTFFFYGNPYSELGVSSNGFVSFTQGSPSGAQAAPLPDAAPPNNMIAFWWSDLSPRRLITSEIRYKTVGSAPNRIFILVFDEVAHYNSDNAATVELKLFETSNYIEFHYPNAATNSELHVVGVENSDGTQGLSYFESTASIPVNTAVRFVRCADNDGDGVTDCDADCDDFEPLAFPGNAEVACDGIDNDCCDTPGYGCLTDPADPSSPPLNTPDGADNDGDGVAACAGDCEDTEPLAYPGNEEVCTASAIDNDCDPNTGEGADLDGDGYDQCGIICDPAVSVCAPDCADDDASRNPGATEVICNGIDEDCDGIDEPDSDMDGVTACGPDGVLGTPDDDCDDSDAGRSPDLVESVCNGIDDDCEDLTPDETNRDGDLDSSCEGDCDDNDPDRYPSNTETTCDGIDNDCNAATADRPDLDGDSYADCPDADCNDADPSINPGQPDVCGDSIDNNCNGFADEAEQTVLGDGFGTRIPPQAGQTQGTTQVTKNVPLGAAILDVDVEIGISHQFTGDLVIRLMSPAGTEVLLSNAHGGSGDDFVGTVFDDEASQPIGTAQAPFTGRFRPDQPLSAFDGEIPNGFWTLTIRDRNVNWAGVLDYWDLKLTVVPDPANPDADGDGYAACAECDDTDALRFPGAPERCNFLDDDCDGSVPLDEFDDDGDGYVECTWTGNASQIQGGDDCVDDPTVDTNGDGRPDGPEIYPSNFEVCDNLDNDCNPGTGDAQDADGDGISTCGLFLGDPADDDCDDQNPDVFPGATELCDGLDNDCDGEIPSNEQIDFDDDGFLLCEDCGDSNATSYPGAPELCDGLDNDCNGLLDFGSPGVEEDEIDNDGDGYVECDWIGLDILILGGMDCLDDMSVDANNDNIPDAPGTYPAAPEDCSNGIDDNCNGQVDEDVDFDGDGSPSCTDCNDEDPDIRPGAPEVCDGRDNDCNTLVDHGSPGLEGREFDDDGDGYVECSPWEGGGNSNVVGGGDCDDDNPSAFPNTPEECDGYDTDCNGEVPADEQDADQDGFPACADCDDANGTAYPGAPEDICDSIDLDCDGRLPQRPPECDGDTGGSCDCGGESGDGAAAALLLALLPGLLTTRRRAR